MRFLVAALLLSACSAPCPKGIDWWVKPIVNGTPEARVTLQCARTRVHDQLDDCEQMKYVHHVGVCWDYDAER